jgi:hypothetical protein
MKLPYKQVVIWGERLVNGRSHTHTYVHAAFMKAYQWLGSSVLWLSDEDDVSSFDFSETLFITEGFKNLKMPIRDDCWYVLHHVDFKRFTSIGQRCINLKAYSTSNMSLVGKCQKIRDFEHVTSFIEDGFEATTLLMPWATHLLPFEFEQLDRKCIAGRRTRVVYWVGSITDGEMGNIEELRKTSAALDSLGIRLIQSKVAEGWESKTAVQQSWIAPAIVGKWQSEVDYLPCRAFKNASLGRLPVSNSSVVNEVFENIMPKIQDTNYAESFVAVREMESSTDLCRYVQELVRANHTYLNRINTIETVFGWR